MAVTATDLFVIDRAGTPFKTTAADIRTYLEDNIGTIFIAADITARDALTGLTVGSSSGYRQFDGIYENTSGGVQTISAGVRGAGNTGNIITGGFLMVRKIN